MRPGTPGPSAARPGQPRRGAAPASAIPAAAMAGAVDLAALKARNEAAARAAEAPAPAAGHYVVTVTEANLQAEVLDRSFQVPVLLLVTSGRAPSADQLTTDLETIVAEQRGGMVLAEVDADAEARIVQMMQIRALPTVHAVIGGQLVPGFEGVLPADQLREFVRAVLTAAQQANLSGAGEPGAEAEPGEQPESEPEVPVDPRFAAAEQALDDDDLVLAAERYQAILDAEPANSEAQLALGQIRLMQRLDDVDSTAVARADAAPADVDAQLGAADLLFASNDIPGALDRLLTAVPLLTGEDRDRVRARLLEFFELLGPDDPRVAPARRQLTRLLF